MTTQTGSYDFKAAKAAHDEASQTASNYITEINDDGIMVHAEGDGPDDTQTPSGWHISDVLEYIRHGVSRFWIGLKNQGDLTPTVRIGKESGESRMELDYHSLQLIDMDGAAYFRVNDLRGSDGKAALTESFAASGRYYDLSYLASQITSCTVDDVPVSYTTSTVASVTQVQLSEVPQSGSTVVIEYTTESETTKSYTLGTRAVGKHDGPMSFAEGNKVEASGYASHAEGDRTKATGRASHAEGVLTEASGNFSHAEGSWTKATGLYSHAEGTSTTASDQQSHAEGYSTAASGNYSHAEGAFSKATEWASHAQNYGTIAASANQTAIGSYNVEDANDTYAVIVGNGSDGSNRSDALTVDWDGNVGCGSTVDMTAPDASPITINTSSNNGCSESSPLGYVNLLDKNGYWGALFGARANADGAIYSMLGAQNKKTDGTNVGNYINVGVRKDGSRYYAVTDPAAFRSAIGGIGTRKAVSPSAVSCPNNTWKEVTSVSLEAGVWIVVYGGGFDSNATGHRDLHLGTSAPGAGRNSPTAVAVNGEQTRMSASITYAPTSTTTFRLYVRQNSGGALNFYPYIQAVKVG